MRNIVRLVATCTLVTDTAISNLVGSIVQTHLIISDSGMKGKYKWLLCKYILWLYTGDIAKHRVVILCVHTHTSAPPGEYLVILLSIYTLWVLHNECRLMTSPGSSHDDCGRPLNVMKMTMILWGSSD